MKRLPPVSIGFLPKGLTCHRGATNWCAIVGRGPRDMRKLQRKWHQTGEKPPAWSTRTTAEAEETSLERDTLWEPDHELAVFRALSPLSSTRAPWDGWVYSPRQAGLSKVTRLVSSSRARTRTQVCWLTAPCCSPSNLLSPTCCQPCNQSYCCSGCRNNNSSINPSHVPGALQSKGSFYHHSFAWISLISSWWEAVGNCSYKHGLWISVLAPWGSAETGGEEGKGAQRSREPSPASCSIPQFLNISHLIFLFKHYKSSWSALFRIEWNWKQL